MHSAVYAVVRCLSVCLSHWCRPLLCQNNRAHHQVIRHWMDSGVYRHHQTWIPYRPGPLNRKVMHGVEQLRCHTNMRLKAELFGKAYVTYFSTYATVIC